MKTISFGPCAVLWLFAIAATAQESGSWDGLVEAKPKRIDAAYVLPGADFRPYQKIMIDPVEVALKKDWLKRQNQSAATLSQRLTQEDAEKIVAEARKIFAEVFAETFQEKGLQIVTAPGADVLRVRPGVVNLDIAAPDTMSAGRSRTYTMEAGEATLFLELLDSTTNALLGRALDRRETRSSGRLQVSNRVTNLGDFRALFKQWAEICVKGFEDLHAMSPVPEDLKPGQKLQP